MVLGDLAFEANRMLEATKHYEGLVTRDEAERSHVYRPRVAEAVTQRQLVTDLLQRAFRGSTASLVNHMVSSPPNAAALKPIAALISAWHRMTRWI